MYQDKILNCRDCGNDFNFSASEQEFFAEKGFTNEPDVARSAELPVSKETTEEDLVDVVLVPNVKCMMQSVQSAVVKPKFLSAQVVIVRFTAVTASAETTVIN